MHATPFTAALAGFEAAQRAWAGAGLASMPEPAATAAADRVAAAEDAATAKLTIAPARTEAELDAKIEALRELIEDGGWADRRELILMCSIVVDAAKLGLIAA